MRGLIAGLIEHVATWPLTGLIDRYHPARGELPKLAEARLNKRESLGNELFVCHAAGQRRY